jgi:tetratricopeptide (TPR) repeat protein
MFYAQSWALIHYMMFGPNMQGGAKLNQFFTKLQQGEEQIKAFQEVFGSLKDMDDAIDQYVRHFAFQVGVIKNPAQMNEKDYVARTMTMAETQAEIGGYHLWTHDLANCTAYVSDALHNDPKLGLAHELQAFLDLSKGQNADSLREFTQAFALDPNLYLSLFAKTMLSPIATSAVPADQEAFKSALRAVIAINPLFAPAYVQLARLAVRQNDLRSALVLSRKAEELEPFRAGYHLQSGQILLRLGQNADAAKFAKYVADRWRGPDHNEAWELWTRVPESQRPPSDPITESAPKDSQRVEGTIKSVSCGKSAPDSDDASQDDQEKDEQKQDSADTAKDTKWSFHLDHDGQALTFHRKSNFAWGFSDSLWYGEDHINMCHNLGGLRAIVHFRPPADSSYSGDVAEIEIRDDLPPAPAPNSPALAAAPAQPSSAAAPPTGASPQ